MQVGEHDSEKNRLVRELRWKLRDRLKAGCVGIWIVALILAVKPFWVDLVGVLGPEGAVGVVVAVQLLGIYFGTGFFAEKLSIWLLPSLDGVMLPSAPEPPECPDVRIIDARYLLLRWHGSLRAEVALISNSEKIVVGSAYLSLYRQILRAGLGVQLPDHVTYAEVRDRVDVLLCDTIFGNEDAREILLEGEASAVFTNFASQISHANSNPKLPF
ncbi:hypothetical protein [Roseobacter sp. N2S]|uniref:hypothetical protein n=1 Tax=Roseobacter sp. N2S TaxID=2663844 RepID=UPI00285CB590|nr:hypothetical protein [Roseobacter sp. N2S]MDR6266562.1 hypothetical protein [Roseobacter sp. N2S]